MKLYVKKNTKECKNNNVDLQGIPTQFGPLSLFKWYGIVSLSLLICLSMFDTTTQVTWMSLDKTTYTWSSFHGGAFSISIIFLIFGCLVTLCLGKVKRDDKFRFEVLNAFYVLLTCAIAVEIRHLFDLNNQALLQLNGDVTYESTTMLILVVTLITIWLIVIAARFTGTFFKRAENLVTLNFLIFFIISLIFAENVLIFFVCSLGTTLCMALLMMESAFTTYEAGQKYVLQSAVVGTFMMLGISLIMYTGFGSVSLRDFGTLTSYDNLTGGLGLILLAILFKLSQFPNHQWAPELYSNISSVALAIFLAPMKLAFVAFLYKLIVLTDTQSYPQMLLWLSATISIVLGAWGALKQSTLSRFLGWTSISNMGMILLPLALYDTNTQEGIILSLYYLIIYSILVTVLIIVLMYLKTDKGESIQNINDLYKISPKDPARSTVSFLFLILGGVPPFVGFVGKVSIFSYFITSVNGTLSVALEEANQADDLLMSWAVSMSEWYVYVVVLFAISIALYNYIGVVGSIYRRVVSEDSKDIVTNNMPNWLHYMIWLVLILFTVYGVWFVDLITDLNDISWFSFKFK